MSNSRPAWRRAPLGALCLCAGLLSLGIGHAARADAPLRTGKFVLNMPPAPNPAKGPNARLSQARRTAHIQTAHTQSTGWLDIALATASDGTSYSLWDHLQDGIMAEWVYDANGNALVEGPTYGPYTDGNYTWAPYDIGVNPTNGRARVLWDRSDGAAGVWVMDANGNAVTIGPTYGPYDGWQAIGIATANDGTSSLLWQRSDGAMSEWALDANGNALVDGPTYGPYPVSSTVSWTPVAIGTNPSDDTARIVWERSDGVVGFWFMDENGNYVSGQNATYGPYSDSGGNWNPNGIATANDGTSSVLWVRDDGAGGVWQLDNNVNVTGVGQVYGPYYSGSDTWYPQYEGLGENPSDDTTRILWDLTNGATGIWTLDPTGTATNVGPVYGPYN